MNPSASSLLNFLVMAAPVVSINSGEEPAQLLLVCFRIQALFYHGQ
jgi:hypothetical protein